MRWHVCYCLSPKFFAQTSIGQYTSNFLQQSSVHAFCHSILLWCIFYGEMSNDAIFLTNFLKKIIFVFATIVCAKTLDLSATLSFYHRLPFEKNSQYFIFCFHRIHPQSSRKVINKGYKIVFPT